MKLWWEGIRAWWLRRFRGFVAAPALHGGRGTSWQEHKRHEIGFTCRCGQVLAFMRSDLVIRERHHELHCTEMSPAEAAIAHSIFADGEENARRCVEMLNSAAAAAGLTQGCDCPITDARHVKICSHCGLGHWNDATPRPFVKGKFA